MKTGYARPTDNTAWGKFLLKSIFVLIVVFFAITSAAIFFSEIFLESGDYFTSWVKISARPTTYAVFWFILMIVSSFVLFEKFPRAQIYVLLILITFMSLSLSFLYWDNTLSVALFFLPILLSVTYFEFRFLNFTFILNLCAFAASQFILFFTKEVLYSNSELFVSFASIALFYSTTLIIQRRQGLLWKKIEATTEKSWRDSLTGLYNHATFFHELEKRFEIQKKSNKPHCLILFDIDDFKKINDRFGHAIGDEVLLSFVKAINHSLAYKDTAYRHGGEEFAVITSASLEDSYMLSEKIRNSFKDYMQSSEYELYVTASAGICKSDMGKFAATRGFYEAADAALYTAKHNGKNQSVIWTNDNAQ